MTSTMPLSIIGTANCTLVIKDFSSQDYGFWSDEFKPPNLEKYKFEFGVYPRSTFQEFDDHVFFCLYNSDFVFAVGGKEFRVHKAILRARSSVFKAMLSANLEEEKKNRVEIIDVDLEVFEQLLNYIYSDTVDKLDEYALELFIAADKYQLDELKSICAQFLGSTQTVDTVTNILVLSDMHSAPELKENCIKFITTNSTKVMATDGWKEMKKTRLELVAELYEDIVKAHSG